MRLELPKASGFEVSPERRLFVSLGLQRLVQDLILLVIRVNPEVSGGSELGLKLGNLHKFLRWSAFLSSAVATSSTFSLAVPLPDANCGRKLTLGHLVERLRTFIKQ